MVQRQEGVFLMEKGRFEEDRVQGCDGIVGGKACCVLNPLLVSLV